jgi:hypothetical protein
MKCEICVSDEQLLPTLPCLRNDFRSPTTPLPLLYSASKKISPLNIKPFARGWNFGEAQPLEEREIFLFAIK